MSAAADQGDPKSLTCRWCRKAKAHHRGGLLCTTCDAPAHLIKEKTA